MFNFRRMSNPISAEQSVCFVLIDFNGATHRPVKSCVLCLTLSQLIPPCSAMQHGLWSASLQNARTSMGLMALCHLCFTSCVWRVGKWDGSKWEPCYLFRGFAGQHQPHFIIQLVESCSSILLNWTLSS